ncbi:MAG: NADH-quinone oxidoreductase subunit A [Candidatus Bathyarchaeota archaeon B23]|nr:MAG: NADH-quinone oxidoreductase subunit A [Candidatus Bathyarchaeota archaeon B23]
MLYIGDYIAFWLFAAIFIVFLTSAILTSKLMAPSRPNPIKRNIYECGQPPFGRAFSFRVTGALRYFGYAVIFFALDAFTWVILASVYSLSPLTLMAVALYTLIILIGIGYFLSELRRMVR